jgi:hypothetical protein
VELHDGPGVTFAFSIPCDAVTAVTPAGGE